MNTAERTEKLKAGHVLYFVTADNSLSYEVFYIREEGFAIDVVHGGSIYYEVYKTLELLEAHQPFDFAKFTVGDIEDE